MSFYPDLKTVLNRYPDKVDDIERIITAYLASRFDYHFELKGQESNAKQIQVYHRENPGCLCEILLTPRQFNCRLPGNDPYLVPEYEFFRWRIYCELVEKLQREALLREKPEAKEIQPDWTYIDAAPPSVVYTGPASLVPEQDIDYIYLSMISSSILEAVLEQALKRRSLPLLTYEIDPGRITTYNLKCDRRGDLGAITVRDMVKGGAALAITARHVPKIEPFLPLHLHLL